MPSRTPIAVFEAGLLIKVGMTSIAVGAVSGFVLVASTEKAGWLTRLGVINRAPIRQVHLDWIIMGILLAVVGLALPKLWAPAVVMILFGGIVNPLLFIPGIFSRTVDSSVAMRFVSFTSYIALSLGLILAAVSAWA